MINITYKKRIVKYHKADVFMENTGKNECKTIVMKAYTTDKLHEDAFLEIRNGIVKM